MTEPDQVPVITLDGPGGVGKGTVCLNIARRLGWHWLDSGSLYRLTALRAGRAGVLEDVDQVAEIARNLDVDYVDQGGEPRVMLEGKDVTEAIRSEDTGARASRISAIQPVREALLQRQRGFARPPGLVADGRDMGTVVFPQAPIKIFLTASPEIRAQRRYNQLIEKGMDVNLPDLVRALQRRDEQDASRQASPLVAAPDAAVIDTGHMSVAEVEQQVMDLVKQRLAL